MIAVAIIIASFYMGCLYTELRILKNEKPIKLKFPQKKENLKTKEIEHHKTADEEDSNPAYQ